MGSGYRVFTAGEVLTASNVQNYLQDQAVMVFGGTAARSSAIGTANFEEGMLTYLTDVDKLQVYTGAAFADVYPAAAAATPMGVLINTTSFSGVSSQLITVFDSTYANYKMIMDISASAGMTLSARYSASGTPFTSANYSYAVFGLTSGNSSVNIAATSQSSFAIATMAWDTEEYEMTIYKPNLATRTAATWQKTGLNSASGPVYFTGGAVLDNGTTFNQIQLLPSTGTITGTVRTYGFNQ